MPDVLPEQFSGVVDTGDPCRLEIARITYLTARWGLFSSSVTTTPAHGRRGRQDDADGTRGSGRVDRHDTVPAWGATQRRWGGPAPAALGTRPAPHAEPPAPPDVPRRHTTGPRTTAR